MSGIISCRSCVSSLRQWLPALGVVAILIATPVIPQVSAESNLGTIEPGKVHIAFNGDMPMASLDDGQLIGTDGEMITRIASNLGLQIVPEQMDWAAEIEAVATGRVDLMIGAVGWTAERSQVMLLSDPIYYFGVFLAQRSTNNWHTVAEMAGKTVGTVTGFSLVPELKAVPGIGEVRLYETSDAVMRDLVAGRLDIAILDPALAAQAITAHPEWALHQLPLDPDPAFPIMSGRYNATIGIRKDAQGLHEAINDQIGDLWATCTNQAIMARYGVTDPSFFTPPAPNPRVGVDRDEGWASPTLNPDCDTNAEIATAQNAS